MLIRKHYFFSIPISLKFQPSFADRKWQIGSYCFFNYLGRLNPLIYILRVPEEYGYINVSFRLLTFPQETWKKKDWGCCFCKWPIISYQFVRKVTRKHRKRSLWGVVSSCTKGFQSTHHSWDSGVLAIGPSESLLNKWGAQEKNTWSWNVVLMFLNDMFF